jgi:hypothetical protein
MADCFLKAAICYSALNRSICSMTLYLVLFGGVGIAKHYLGSGMPQHGRPGRSGSIRLAGETPAPCNFSNISVLGRSEEANSLHLPAAQDCAQFCAH